ncbi:MAG: DUF3109 family protein [Bacteroides sp.]|nr:DUF3109 family protein [Bacteroides sp.]
MLQIGSTLISLDLIDRYFECDLGSCLGECCVEGDAGAPLTEEEAEKLIPLAEELAPELLPGAQRVLAEQGPSYRDQDGDLVTSIVDGRDCIFTTYGPGGVCLCALEKARREGRPGFFKPISCSLYPVRVKEYDAFTAVNLHRWKICKCAEVLGRAKGIRAYQFLKEPLIRRFGEEWYKELEIAAEHLLKEHPNGLPG